MFIVGFWMKACAPAKMMSYTHSLLCSQISLQRNGINTVKYTLSCNKVSNKHYKHQTGLGLDK